MQDTMSDLDSLEDMLAALETPSGSGGRATGGGGRQNVGASSSKPGPGARASVKNVPPPDDDDIDAFLNEIDAGSPAKPSNTRPGPSASQSRPVSQQAQTRPGPAASQSRPPQQQQRSATGSVSSPARAVASPSIGDGNAELESQGYEIQNNRGKWFNPAKTNKASDFRINGTTSTRVGFVHAITLRSLDDYGNPAKIENYKEFIGITLTHQGDGSNVQPWIRDNGDCTYNCAFFADRAGTIRMEIKLCGNPMFDINVQVEDIGESLWVAKPILPARPKELFIINIVTVDGSRPEGVAPFEVQTMGDAEQLRLINNGDGTYKFQCVPQSNGHLTVQVSLHGQPIRDSPVTAKVGDGKIAMKVKQESGPVEVISDTRGQNTYSGGTQDTFSGQTYDADPIDDYNDPPPIDDYPGDQTYDDYGGETIGDGGGQQDVSNDDLAALLDELGG